MDEYLAHCYLDNNYGILMKYSKCERANGIT